MAFSLMSCSATRPPWSLGIRRAHKSNALYKHSVEFRINLKKQDGADPWLPTVKSEGGGGGGGVTSLPASLAD